MTEENKQTQALRELVFDLQTRGEGDDTVPVIVSSDAVVEVADGPEVLVHTPEAVDLQRAPLPIIATHRGNQINVGLVENLRFERGFMRGDARFGERQEAAEYKRDVLNRIIRSVSVGYARLKGTLRKDGVLVTTRWMPTHVAMVAEPADVRAGFFRHAPAFEMDRESPEPVTPTAAPAAQPERPKMAEVNQAAAGANAEDGAQRAATLSAQPRQGPSGLDIENERVATIRNLCEGCNIDAKIRDMWITSGTSTKAASEEIMAIQRQRSEATPKVTAIGLSDPEIRKFSLSRAIEACAAQNWTNAGLEAEASREIQRRLNRTASPNKFFVPWEIQERQNPTPAHMVGYSRNYGRDLTVASAGAGGYLKGTENIGFIELLRNKSALYNMGAMRMPGLTGDVTIPKQSATGSATWLANEASTISEINQTFVQIALSPKNVGGYTEISRQLLLQSNPSIEGIVMTDLANVVALEIDLKGINGNGSGAPTGLLNTAGIGSVTGTSMDYADIIEFMTDVFGGNALTGNSGYLTTGAVAGLLKNRMKASSTWSPIWEGRLDEGMVDGYRGMASNQMPSATMIFGDFGLGMVIAEWGVLEMEVNPYANFQAGIVGVRAIASIDIGVRYPTAFSAASSIT